MDLTVKYLASCGSEPLADSVHTPGLYLAWQLHYEEAVQRYSKTGDSKANQLRVRVKPEREYYQESRHNHHHRRDKKEDLLEINVGYTILKLMLLK